jgi:DNA-binding transcriptional ArsR family regulator
MRNLRHDEGNRAHHGSSETDKPLITRVTTRRRCSRYVGTVWDNNGTIPGAEDPLTDLIGPSRTAILRNAELPRTTTDLARELGVSGATISVHLSILKRCGMVTSWRSGRRVLYQRTPLASSILSAVIQPES